MRFELLVSCSVLVYSMLKRTKVTSEYFYNFVQEGLNHSKAVIIIFNTPKRVADDIMGMFPMRLEFSVKAFHWYEGVNSITPQYAYNILIGHIRIEVRSSMHEVRLH